MKTIKAAISGIPSLDEKGLSKFGLVTGLIFAVLFGVIIPGIHGRPFTAWPWVTAGLLWVWAVFWPGSLNPLYRVWMTIGGILGWINTRIILSFVFFFVITPIGLIRSLVGRHAIERKFDPELKSYRTASKIEPGSKMEDPF